jgi:CheY-like chemotaxis protein
MDEKAPLLLVNANGHHVALIVDEIKGKSDIVMKSLGTHLRQVHGIAGGTVLGNGQVVLILELNDLLATRRLVTNVSGTETRKATTNSLRWEGPVPASTPAVSQARQGVDLAPTRSSIATRPPQTPALPERAKHILVVDDSPSVRRVVSNMLKQHNWEVQMARDGVEALEMITRETPAAVLLDIEMPRMDGYELTATVRAQAQYRTLPLIVLTSRAAGKHQQRAMQLGASAYVVKPYQDEELLNTINSLVYGTVTR